MLYFSYGSNMSSRRLLQRAPSATFVAVASLVAHELRFHKISNTDGSAKCDAFETGENDHLVYGVLYQMSSADKGLLDLAEGLGHGYDEKIVQVTSPDDELLQATTYYATNIDPTLRPYHWYKEHVVRGAWENGLPAQYVEWISGVNSITDPQPQRHEKELAIYL